MPHLNVPLRQKKILPGNDTRKRKDLRQSFLVMRYERLKSAHSFRT